MVSGVALRRIGIAAALMASVLMASVLIASQQESPKTFIEIIGRNFGFTEGPAWSKEGVLYFSDTQADKIWKFARGGEPVSFREPSNGASGNAFDSDGRLYTCETHARRVTRTNLKDGKIDVIADQFEGKKFNAPCDLAVSKSDHVYFTDPAFGNQQDHRELDFYGVYHVAPKGAPKLVGKSTGRPHGVAISPNGRTLYVTNADEHNLRAYELDHNGDASGEKVLVDKIDGIPGGMRVTDKGELFVVTTKSIEIYTPEGKTVRSIPMHDRPSNCALDPQGVWLYVTASNSLYRVRVDGKVGN